MLETGMRWVHLRLCLTCGHVGCCDASPGVTRGRTQSWSAIPSSSRLSRGRLALVLRGRNLCLSASSSSPSGIWRRPLTCTAPTRGSAMRRSKHCPCSGEVQFVTAGDVLFRSGEHPDACYVVLEGTVGEVDGEGPHQRLIAVHGPRRFLGEINALTGGPVFLGAVALRMGSVLRSPSPSFGTWWVRIWRSGI